MRSVKNAMIRHLAAGIAVAACASAFAAPVGALELEFSQTAGFFAPSAELKRVNGGNPVAGRGGLEFFGPVLAPPGPPEGDGTVPPDIFQEVAWGCLFGEPPSPATCANGGVIGIDVVADDPSDNPARSTLAVEGQFGVLTDTEWKDITVVTHVNHRISDRSNILSAIDVHSFLRLGPDGVIVDTPAPAVVHVEATETPNVDVCSVSPAPGAPVNPLGSRCDDFAIVKSLDLASVFIPAGAVGNDEAMFIDFRLFAAPGAGALVCDGSAAQPAACGGYAGPDVIIYTAENATNTLSVQARLRPADIGPPLPLFVIGDVEPHDIGDVVTFWGAQWWKKNFMSGVVDKGVARFKGFANHANDFCGGVWESRPGNSSGPPETIPDRVAVIVTDSVLKDGPIVSGNIKQIVLVEHDGKYGPAPGHRGRGPVVEVLCTAP